MKKLIILSTVFIFILSGCNEQNNEGSGKETNQDIIKTRAEGEVYEQPSASKAKEVIEPMEKVKEFRAVDLDKKLFVALELKHQYTFQSKKVINDVKKKLEEEMSDKKIEVTSDHKIFIELEKLEEELENQKIGKKELNNRLEKLEKLMKQSI